MIYKTMTTPDTLWPNMGFGDPPDKFRPPSQLDVRSSKTIALWVPYEHLGCNGIDFEGLLESVNTKIAKRGFITWDGQILANRLEPTNEPLLAHNGDDPLILESDYYWGPSQRNYFGLQNPYEMFEDAEEYTHSNVMFRINSAYLFNGEVIIGLIDGLKDNRHYYCYDCHQAEIVLTSMQRLVCMGCGAMHAVLAKQLKVNATCHIKESDWFDYFDINGCKNFDDLNLSIIDFQQIENCEMIWTTHQWDCSSDDFIFYARSSPEEIRAAARNTERDISVWLEAGYEPIPTAPAPAFQVSDSLIDIDLAENAGLAFSDGSTCFMRSQTNPTDLVNAVLEIFRATELLLKAKLKQIDVNALADHPNNPTVLNRLNSNGVIISIDELSTIQTLRRLRNQLQHSEANLNYRSVRRVCYLTILFINRFAHSELGLWIGDVVSKEDWPKLIKFPEIESTAVSVASDRLRTIQANEDNPEVLPCPQCSHTTLVRPYPGGGAICLVCQYYSVAGEHEED